MKTTKLEKIIADLVDHKQNASDAEVELINRQLTNLCYSYEEAGGIIEDLDPF
jgi:hypothetical protein